MEIIYGHSETPVGIVERVFIAVSKQNFVLSINPEILTGLIEDF